MEGAIDQCRPAVRTKPARSRSSWRQTTGPCCLPATSACLRPLLNAARVSLVWSKPLIRTTALLWCTWLFIALTYHGVNTWLPIALGAVGMVILGREPRGRPLQDTIREVGRLDDVVFIGQPAEPAEAPASGLVRRPAAWAKLARLRVASFPNCQGGC